MYNPLEFLALEKSKRVKKFEDKIKSISNQIQEKIEAEDYVKTVYSPSFVNSIELAIKNIMIDPEDLSNPLFMETLNEYFNNFSWDLIIEEKKDGQLDLFEGYNVKLKQKFSLSVGATHASYFKTNGTSVLTYDNNGVGILQA